MVPLWVCQLSNGTVFITDVLTHSIVFPYKQITKLFSYCHIKVYFKKIGH